jgi:hypothetical protein
MMELREGEMRAGSHHDGTDRPAANRGALAWAAILIGLLSNLPAPAFAFDVGATTTCIGPIFNHQICPPWTQLLGAGIHQKITGEALLPFQYQSGSGTITFPLDKIIEIEDANAAVDGFQQNPEFHFDAFSYDGVATDETLAPASQRLIDGQAFLLDQLNQSATINAQQAHQLRVLFGNYLHILQDFYAHTNFVNVFPPPAVAHLGTAPIPNQVPGTNPCFLPAPLGPLVYPNVAYLTSGWADQTVTAIPPFTLPSLYLTAPAGQCAHGAPSSLIALGAPPGGMHKDDPGSGAYIRPYYQQAHDAALADTTNFANAILGAASNMDNVCMFMTDQTCSGGGPTTTVTFGLGADDFGSLSIGGKTICTFDDVSRAGGCTGSFQMSQGVWYDIVIDYKNRLGSDGLSLSWDQPGPASIGYGFSGSQTGLVPLANLRTAQGGGFVPGLRGDYYDLNGNLQSTAMGEGPIDAINNIYNNAIVGSWNGYGYFSLFEERLTGQIRLGP